MKPAARACLAAALAFLMAGAAAADAPRPYPEPAPGERPSVRVEITPADKAGLRDLVNSSMDIHHVHGMTAEALVTPAQLGEIRSRGHRVLTINEDVYNTRLRGGGWLPEYKSYSEVETELNALASAYPALASLSVIGLSLEGRNIYALKISDNVATDESEPEVLIQANMHSREVITPIIAMALADSLLTNYGSDPQITQWVDGREIWIVPTLNPDGLVYVETTDLFWRKNRRPNGGGNFGVDLNRNYDYEWGHDNNGSSPFASSEIYRGPSGNSEPETQVITSFINSRQFVFAISYHSFGNLVLWGPGYEPGFHVDEDIHHGFGQEASAANNYTPGNAANGVIYLVNGDSDDWAYSAATSGPVLAFTPEVGTSSDYFNPPASRIPTLVAEGLDPAWVAIEHADRPGRLAPPGQVAVNAIPPSATGSYDVTWSAPATADMQVVQYEVTEKTGPAVVTEDVESGTAAWNAGGWTASTSRAFSGTTSLYSGSGNDLNRIALAAEGYVVQPSDAFTFRAWYNIEVDYDYAYAILSTDGGRSFVNLAGTGTTTADPNGTNAGNGITGSSSGWQLHTYDLSAWVGQTVWLGFRYYSDGGVAPEGIYVDDIAPVQTWATSTVLSATVPGPTFAVSGRGDGTYWYSVRGQDAEGDWGYRSADVAAVVNLSTDVSVAGGRGFFLDPAVPSPFGASTSIRFGLGRAGDHSLAVFDVGGRRVRTLSSGRLPAGPHAVRWDGRGDEGTKVPSGVYFYRLTTQSGAKIDRTVVLR